MKLDLADEYVRSSETRDAVTFPPEDEAVRYQEEIVSLKLRIEELEAKRDEAVAKALANGVKFYGGYRFAEKVPASTLSEKKFATQYPEILDGFIAWYKETHEVKLSKVELSKYLKTVNHENPNKVIADISEPGKGAVTVTITKQKEVEE